MNTVKLHNTKVSELEARRYTEVCVNLENRIKEIKNDAEVILYFPYQVFTEESAKNVDGAYTGMHDALIAIDWDFKGERVLSSKHVHFDLASGRIWRITDRKIYLTEYLEEVVSDIKKGVYDLNS